MESKQTQQQTLQKVESEEMRSLYTQVYLELLALGADIGSRVLSHHFGGDDSAMNVNRDACDALRDMIKRIGWPTVSKVTATGANVACAIVIGSKDPEFQEYCLGLIKSQPKDEVPLKLFARLEDIVRVTKGQPQFYGTFSTMIGSKKVFFPVEDPENLEKRRQEMGLNNQD